MRKNWVYLSPHFDDVALSCGGLIWNQVQEGNAVWIWTVCAGDIPNIALSPFAQQLHLRWKTGNEATLIRKEEDKLSCQVLGAAYKHLDIPDCIYRRGANDEFLYQSNEALFGKLSAEEKPLIKTLSIKLQTDMAQNVHLVCPLAIGNHVDHQLVRAAAELVGYPLYYYADFPYVLENIPQLGKLLKYGFEKIDFPLSAASLDVWHQAVAAHHSQISSFWRDDAAMREAIGKYHQDMGGVNLWYSAK